MSANLFFGIAPALSAVFQLGFEPKEECFIELTCEQYEQVKEEGEDITEKWYMVLPIEPKHLTPDTFVASEEEKEALLQAAKVIENYCNKSDKIFASYDDKLKHVSNLLPPVFTKDSKYKRSHLKLVESNE